MVDNMTRKENILILPYNTLRIVDAIVQLEIYKLNKKTDTEPLDELIFKVVTRTNKDLGYYNNADQELINELIKLDYKKFYNLAPRTDIYDMIHLLSLQKFISNIYILFDDNTVSDDAYKNIYYNGSLDELIKIIKRYNITAIVMHDVDLLKSIYDKDKSLLESKSIIIPKYGYNYYRNERGDLRLKYYKDYFRKVPHLEIGTPNVVKFSKTTLDKYKKKEEMQ